MFFGSPIFLSIYFQLVNWHMIYIAQWPFGWILLWYRTYTWGSWLEWVESKMDFTIWSRWERRRHWLLAIQLVQVYDTIVWGIYQQNNIPFVPNLPVSFDGKRTFICEACCKAKQTRSSFPISMNKTMHAFEVIQCDIWDPYKMTSFSRSHYFLTIVDHFSQTTWVFVMNYKQETRAYWSQFFNLFYMQFNLRVKTLGTDNGLEFTHNDLLSYYIYHGMEHQTSCMDTSQQNRVVEHEHEHRHLVHCFLSSHLVHWWAQVFFLGNHTWTLEHVSFGKRAIDSKWF